jgi:hypothetical protein
MCVIRDSFAQDRRQLRGGDVTIIPMYIIVTRFIFSHVMRHSIRTLKVKCLNDAIASARYFFYYRVAMSSSQSVKAPPDRREIFAATAKL